HLLRSMMTLSLHDALPILAIALGTPVIVSNAFGALSFIDTHKFPTQDFCFNPQVLQELIDILEPYINKKGLESNYFKTMYEQTFKKDEIYNQIKAVIMNSNKLS